MSEHIIRVDAATAEKLSQRADELGLSVSDLVASLAAVEAAPMRVAPDQIDELRRRLTSALAPDGTVTHRETVGWLQTWGAASYRPRRD